MFSGLVRRRVGDPQHRQSLPVAACVHALAPLFMSFGSSSRRRRALTSSCIVVAGLAGDEPKAEPCNRYQRQRQRYRRRSRRKQASQRLCLATVASSSTPSRMAFDPRRSENNKLLFLLSAAPLRRCQARRLRFK